MRKHPVPGDKNLPHGLVILHEDRDIIVVDKPAGLLSMGTDRHKEHTAYFILVDYVRKGAAKSRNRVFIVHRLDRETSGVLIFAKTEAAQQKLKDNWKNTHKTYLAVVHGKLAKSEDTISNYLAENALYQVYATNDTETGKLARTAYRVIKETKIYSLLEVELLTGRKHQIRVHFAGIGHPVVGDKKYGKPDDPRKQLALHARSISFDHPYSGKRMTFVSELPEYFKTLIGNMPDEKASFRK